MRRKRSLPPRLGTRFHIRDADTAGVRRWRRDVAELHRPFPGIRTVAVPSSFRARIECYLPRLKPSHCFAGKTAARIWGLPVSTQWALGELLEVVVTSDAAPPVVTGVQGRRLSQDRLSVSTLSGLRVLDPVATLFMLAEGLTVNDAVVLIDALVADSDNYPGLRSVRPLSTLALIRTRFSAWRRFPGCATIRAALDLARPHVESPKETATRLAIVEAGLPEPEVQYVVMDGVRKIAKVDLAYPGAKIAIEYEGDGHRTDKAQWREDIRRQRELEGLGWIVIRITQDDLVTSQDSFLTRIERALADRRPA